MIGTLGLVYLLSLSCQQGTSGVCRKGEVLSHISAFFGLCFEKGFSFCGNLIPDVNSGEGKSLLKTRAVENEG